MKHLRQRMLTATLALVAALAAGCSDATDPVAPSLDSSSAGPSFSRLAAARHGSGAVYLMSNAAGPNQVLVFERAADGSLSAQDPVATGGMGTGAGLGNQGALALTRDRRWLLVVNAGSDDVSLLRVTPRGLHLADRAPSGGTQPISVTVHGRVVFVLNAGTPNNVSGLWIGFDGKLHPIPGSTRSLSGDGVGPAQVGFSPDGRSLVVTEKATNMITTFAVRPGGRLSQAESHPSANDTPFGFAFNDRGVLIVSEAAGGGPDASTVSSYRVLRNGSLELLDGAVPLTETAACWVAIPENGRFAYITNAGSGTVSGVSIGRRGRLELLDDDGVTGVTGEGSTPLDAAFSRGGRYLYVLSSGAGMVNIFGTDAHGALTPMGSVEVPATANGMAAL